MAPEFYVRSNDELHNLWRKLMGDGGFARRSLWLIFLDHSGLMLPVIVPIDDLPDEPEPELLSSVTTVIDGLDDERLRSVAFLLTRPGSGTMTAQDRRWGKAVRGPADTGAVGTRLRQWPMYLATANRVQQYGPVDLA
ncbi:MAG: hypothetical protein JWM76_1233 [Pseudonocardiales bacterium]|nr:hypothetical protein [Pseudonocardiales bacterium]